MFLLKNRHLLTVITFVTLVYAIFSFKFYLDQNFISKNTKMKETLNKILNGKITEPRDQLQPLNFQK